MNINKPATDIIFEYTWCDYLTRCPHYKRIDVGSFDCRCCDHYCGSRFDIENKEIEIKKLSHSHYKRYATRFKGIVYCKYSENNETS